MNRNRFLSIAGGTILTAGGLAYLASDKSNFVRADSVVKPSTKSPLTPDERKILYLASLAPSGHNTQPWFVRYIEPYHWIIGNDKRKWLPAVDPAQRETMLSLGAFLQNLAYAASHAGYTCHITVLATTNQSEEVAVVKLTKAGHTPDYDVSRIKNRRTVRSNFLPDALTSEDQHYLFGGEPDFFHFFPNTATEYQFLNEQTITANRVQSDRDAAQQELSDWVRFSSKDAEQHSDGLTHGQHGHKWCGWLFCS